VPAKALGLGDQVGSIAPGMQADIIATPSALFLATGGARPAVARAPCGTTADARSAVCRARLFITDHTVGPHGDVMT
jgi:cytosine/adenosine deaminase-related metal-dependent hydrolase